MQSADLLNAAYAQCCAVMMCPRITQDAASTVQSLWQNFHLSVLVRCPRGTKTTAPA